MLTFSVLILVLKFRTIIFPKDNYQIKMSTRLTLNSVRQFSRKHHCRVRQRGLFGWIPPCTIGQSVVLSYHGNQPIEQPQ